MWNPEAVYNKYYSTGTYNKRYPNPNINFFKKVLPHINKSRSLLDFGCGEGRHLFSILEFTSANVVAYDISTSAIDNAKNKLKSYKHRERVIKITSSFEEINAFAPFDTIICMFGVISHIAGVAERNKIFHTFRHKLLKKDGKLIVSVPNSYRRFICEQLKYFYQRKNGNILSPASEPSDIMYTRKIEGQSTPLFYHLYTPYTLKQELTNCGFTINLVAPESFFPESFVVNNKILAYLDFLFTSFLPASFGYGILAVAEVNNDSHEISNIEN